MKTPVDGYETVTVHIMMFYRTDGTRGEIIIIFTLFPKTAKFNLTMAVVKNTL